MRVVVAPLLFIHTAHRGAEQHVHVTCELYALPGEDRRHMNVHELGRRHQLQREARGSTLKSSAGLPFLCWSSPHSVQSKSHIAL